MLRDWVSIQGELETDLKKEMTPTLAHTNTENKVLVQLMNKQVLFVMNCGNRMQNLPSGRAVYRKEEKWTATITNSCKYFQHFN